MNGTRERRAISAAPLADVETYHALADDPIEQMHARDHAHFAAYNAALTTGMHKDRAHDLATESRWPPSLATMMLQEVHDGSTTPILG